MDKIHCIQIVFPFAPDQTASKFNCSSTGSSRSPSLPKQPRPPCRIPPIIKRKLTISPEDIISFSKTTINHVEEKFSPLQAKPSPSRRQFIKNSQDPRLYLKFYKRLEAEKNKHIGKRNPVKINKRDNPWRYSALSPDSVFDVTELAEKTFNAKKRTLSS